MAGGAGLMAASAGIQGVLGLTKGIFGAIQAARGNKQLNRLLANRPQYNISQGYQDAYKTYQSLANSNLPGYDIMQGQIGQSTARANTQLERGAMGSNQFMAGALQTQSKELDAIKNLGLMSAQWRTQQQQQLAGAQNQMGQLQDQQFQTNILDPYNINLNMANERKQAGLQNLFGGVQDAAGGLMNYAGTKYYMDALKGLNPRGGNSVTPQLGSVAGFQQLQAPPLPPLSFMNYKGTLNG